MLNLDHQEIEIQCTECGFYNPVFLKQIHIKDTIICHGCKSNIDLNDYKNEYRKVKKELDKSLNNLKKSFNNIRIEL